MEGEMRRYAIFGAYAGVLLIIAGMLNFATGRVWNLVSTLPVAGGLVLLAFFAIVRFRDFAKLFSMKSVRYGGNTLALALIVLLILGVVNYIAGRHSMRADLTAAGQFSLSQQTKQVLNKLDKEVHVTAFFQSGQQDGIQDLLDSYRFHSKKFHYEFVDPDKKPAIAKQYGITSYGTLVLESQSRVEKITETQEQDVTNAMIKVIREGKKTIYFLDGHGENDIEDGEQTGYEGARKAIEEENYGVSKLLLAEKKSIPADCSVLVVNGPKHALFASEMDTLRQYLERGGKALFLIDPAPVYGFRSLLKEWGVEAGDDVVLDVSGVGQIFGMGPSVPLVSAYEPHPITEKFRVMTFFPYARSVTPIEELPSGLLVQPLFKTSENSWGESDLSSRQARFDEGKDRMGPITLGVAVSREKDGKKTRIVVVGDSDFGNNTYFGSQGNRDLFMNMVSWLAEEEDLISIRPRDPEDRRISMTAQQANWMMYVTVILMPLAALAAGVAMYIKRERK